MIEMLPVFAALVGVVAVMLGVIYLMKWLNKRITGGRNGKGITILSCVSVGQDKTVVAVRAGRKNLLLGVAQGGVNLLCELDEEDVTAIEGNSNDNDNSMAGKSFGECLKHNMKKMGGGFFAPYGTADKQDDDSSDNSDQA